MIVTAAAVMIGAQQIDPGPPGASRAFTSKDPAVVTARQLLERGLFEQAGKTVAEASLPADVRDEVLEIIRRTRHEYSLDADALLAKLRRSIPDVTAADLDRWRTAGEAQYRMIDGAVRYWRREPSNIFRFSEEAKRRRDAAGAVKPGDSEKLVEHIRNVLAEADATGRDEVAPVRHRVRYTLTVKPDPALKAGSRVRCWLPYPQVYRQQGDVELASASPGEPRIAPAASFNGATISGAPQRTIYLESTIADPSQPIRFAADFSFVSRAYCPKLDDAAARPLPADWNGGGLGERLPHIAMTPELLAEVKAAVGDERNPVARARRIYLHLCKELRYAYEEEYTIIPSLSIRTHTRRRGDCGAQAMLFIAMCRAAGIPARWQSGWETKPWGWNMHDWAEFYVAPWGWLPADVSYGLQESDDPRVREFYFGHIDSYRMIVNLDYGTALQPPKESLRSEPADFQRGEVEVDGRNLYFDAWDYDVQFEWQPASH